MARKPERLSVHPAAGVHAAQQYIQVSGFTLLAIKQHLEMVELMGGTPQERLDKTVARIREELAKVDAILPEDSEL